MPYGDPPRPNRACPRCGALQRHRVLALYLDRELEITKRSYRILHIAPERAIRPLLEASPNKVYASVDLTLSSASVRAALADLPFADGCFDVVVCSHVLEHIDQDVQCMTEMGRVLSPGGQALIMVPVDRSLAVTYEDSSISGAEARLRAFGHPEHVRYYGPDVVDRLRTSGFAVEEVDYTARLAPGEAVQAVVGPGEIIYVCRRPPS